MADEVILGGFGGLNTDDSLISPGGRDNPFENGDFRYSRNVRIGSSIEDNIGAIENLPSTLEINNYNVWNGSAWVAGAAPAGTNLARGIFEDKDEGALYWAVYNSNGNDQILKFVKATRTIYELLTWTGLNFDSKRWISICKINNYLIITDKINPPRVVKTDIYVLRATLGAAFSEYHISFAKWPPLAPAFVLTFGAVGNLQIQTGLFQFAYRYVYFNGFRSTWGPPSQFVTIQNNAGNTDEAFRLEVPGYIYDYENNTYFEHTSIKFYSVVQYIEFGYRQSTRDTWKLFKRQTVSGTDNRFVDFTNAGPNAAIANDDIGLYFDSVPFYSGNCESIDNRPLFADNQDDLTVSDFRVTNVEVYSDFRINLAAGAISAYTSLNATYKNILAIRNTLTLYSFKERGIYKLGIIFQHFSGRTGLVNTTDEWTYLIPATIPSGGSEGFSSLGFKIPGDILPPDWAVGYQIVRSNCLNFDFFIEGTINDFVYLGLDTTPPAVSDQIQTPQNVQDITNQYYDNIDPSKQDLSALAQRLSTYYRKSVVVTTLAAASQIYIDVSNWYQATVSGVGTYNPSNNLFYQFQRGDRLRLKGNHATNPPVFDVEVVDFTGQGIIINKPAGLTDLLRRDDPGAPAFAPSFTIEIYRLKPFSASQEVIFYEMGEWYPVTNPLTPSRDFEKRDWTWTDAPSVTPTAGSFPDNENFQFFNKYPVVSGDVHLVSKRFGFTKFVAWSNPYVELYFMQMNQDANNAVGFWEHNNGRALASYQYPPVNIDKPGQARFGGKFLEDSIFININRMRDEWQFIYPSEYGRIRRMVNTSNAQVESVGNIVVFLGEQEAWSVYVNRTTLEDLSGRSQVSISDKVLGSFNTLLGSQGTMNPESAKTHNGRLLWWNVSKGTWNRYSRDGITEISEIGMKNWFRDMSDLIIDTYSTSTPARVISTFDNYHKEWITRIDHSGMPSTFREYASYKCASFAERSADKRWKSIYDYAPDLFAQLNNEVYSIIGSKVHIHEEGIDYGKMYTVAVPSQFEPVANIGGRQVKDWRNVAIVGTDKWSFERIRGDWKSNGKTIQETRLALSALESLEDTFWSEIRRNKNTVNAASEALAVVNGEQMKSKSLRLLMQLDPAIDYLSVLNWIVVTFDLSAKNPKK